MKVFITYELMTESFQYVLVSVVSALVQEMAWRQSDHMPLLVPMLTEIYDGIWHVDLVIYNIDNFIEKISFYS